MILVDLQSEIGISPGLEFSHSVNKRHWDLARKTRDLTKNSLPRNNMDVSIEKWDFTGAKWTLIRKTLDIRKIQRSMANISSLHKKMIVFIYKKYSYVFRGNQCSMRKTQIKRMNDLKKTRKTWLGQP